MSLISMTLINTFAYFSGSRQKLRLFLNIFSVQFVLFLNIVSVQFVIY